MNLKDIFRWIAVLPAAVIASILCYTLLMIMVLIGDLFSGKLRLYLEHPEILSLDHIFLSFILSAILGYVFVFVGVATSPRYKRIVAFVLFALIAILFGFLIIFSLLITSFADSWGLLVSSVICIIAAGACAFSTEEQIN